MFVTTKVPIQAKNQMQQWKTKDWIFIIPHKLDCDSMGSLSVVASFKFFYLWLCTENKLLLVQSTIEFYSEWASTAMVLTTVKMPRDIIRRSWTASRCLEVHLLVALKALCTYFVLLPSSCTFCVYYMCSIYLKWEGDNLQQIFEPLLHAVGTHQC